MYVINVVFPPILYFFLCLLIRNNNIIKRIFFIFTFLYLVSFLSLFNYQTFPDVRTYNRHYEFLTTNTISDFYYYHGNVLEVGYIIFNKILTLISSDPRTLYIIRGIIFSISILWVIKKHSTNYLLSILIFFLCFGVNQSIFVVRQYIALAIFLLSIDSILHKHLLKYIFIWILSFSFHGSMIVFFPLYWLYNYIHLSKYSIWSYMLITIIGACFMHFLFRKISESMGFYEAYLLFSDDEGTSAGMLIRTLVIFVPFLLFCFRRIYSDVYGKLFFVTGLLNVAVAITVIGIPSGSRLVTNYNSFAMLSIPYVVSSLSVKNTRYIYICTILLIFYVLYFLRLSNYGYYFIWQECHEYFPDTIDV